MPSVYDDDVPFPQTFRVGDIVRLKTGRSKQVVRAADLGRGLAKVEYVSVRGIPPKWEKFERLELIEFDLDNIDDEKENTMSGGKLYQTLKTDPVLYGTYLAKNSKGQVVLEIKGNDGGVRAFDPDEIEDRGGHSLHDRGA